MEGGGDGVVMVCGGSGENGRWEGWQVRGGGRDVRGEHGVVIKVCGERKGEGGRGEMVG